MSGDKAKETKKDKESKESKKEEKPQSENNQSVFLEMQKSMAQAIENLNKQMENIMIMVRPQTQWMGPSQRTNHVTCNSC
jgi:hypothetical protein